MPGLLGSSARTETRSRRLATVTLLTFAQATVGLSALAQLPPTRLLTMNDFRLRRSFSGRSTVPQKAGIKRGGRKVAHDRASLSPSLRDSAFAGPR